jgi:hypothetical protein
LKRQKSQTEYAKNGSPDRAHMRRRAIMTSLKTFAKLTPLIVASVALSGCESGLGGLYNDNGRYSEGRGGSNSGGYYADEYYRDGPNYRERRLADNDEIYRGRDGRYYCKREDGTTGLIVGGLAGGVLGNVIAPGGSKTLGSVIGAVGGAIAGRAIEKGSDGRNNVRCR